MTAEYVTLIGIIIQTGLYLLGGYALVIRNDASNMTLREQVKQIQDELKALATVITAMAVQEEKTNGLTNRMNQLDDKLERLRRGDGFVAGSRGIEREH